MHFYIVPIIKLLKMVTLCLHPPMILIFAQYSMPKNSATAAKWKNLGGWKMQDGDNFVWPYKIYGSVNITYSNEIFTIKCDIECSIIKSKVIWYRF